MWLVGPCECGGLGVPGPGHGVEATRQTCVPPQEHIIHVWEETGSRFHNCLIQLYCEKVQGLMKAYLLSFPAGTRARRKSLGPWSEASRDPRVLPVVEGSRPLSGGPQGAGSTPEGPGRLSDPELETQQLVWTRASLSVSGRQPWGREGTDLSSG